MLQIFIVCSVDILTADERQQLAGWFEEKAARSRAISIKYAPQEIVEKLDLLAECDDPGQVADDQIEAIKAALSGLLQARRSHKKRQS